MRHVTGRPIKFVGVAEKIGGLERFDAERMAGRVLGMGDIVSLVEDVQKSIDVKEAEKLARKMQSGDKFDLNDFRDQIGQMRKMGGLSSMLEKLRRSSRKQPARSTTRMRIARSGGSKESSTR